LSVGLRGSIAVRRTAEIGASLSFERVPAKDRCPPISSRSPQLSRRAASGHDGLNAFRRRFGELLASDPVALAGKRCALLSRLTGVSENSIWQWAFIERLVIGLHYREVGPEENAAEFLAVVEAWAGVKTM
jgi:hypothetical protein